MNKRNLKPGTYQLKQRVDNLWYRDLHKSNDWKFKAVFPPLMKFAVVVPETIGLEGVPGLLALRPAGKGSLYELVFSTQVDVRHDRRGPIHELVDALIDALEPIEETVQDFFTRQEDPVHWRIIRRLLEDGCIKDVDVVRVFGRRA